MKSPQDSIGSNPPNAEMICPLCGQSELIGRHCKSICEQCGYVESCEDIFPLIHAGATSRDENTLSPSRGLA